MSRAFDFDTVILAGGGSTRMGGADKPGLAVGATPMLVSVARAAAGAGTGRLIVVGPGRTGLAHDGLAALGRGRSGGLTCVVEEPAGSGPVAALRRGIAEVGAPRLVLLAADLPFLASAHVLELLTAADSAEPEVQPPADRSLLSAGPAGVVAVDAAGAAQWLVSSWRADSLRAALADFAGTSLRGLLGPLNPVRVGLAARGALPPWLDCDTPDDLAAARRAWLASTANAEAES